MYPLISPCRNAFLVSGLCFDKSIFSPYPNDVAVLESVVTFSCGKLNSVFYLGAGPPKRDVLLKLNNWNDVEFLPFL